MWWLSCETALEQDLHNEVGTMGEVELQMNHAVVIVHCWLTSMGKMHSAIMQALIRWSCTQAEQARVERC